jgi:phosphatidylserine/phosphatidylglycerophosphate/cardiolipin synthase-like enzyme
MPKLRNNPGWILLVALLVSMPVCAGITGDAALAAANASVEVAFTPGDDAAGKIVSAISHARRQVLVQAYSFTHDGIAGALLEAHRRGVDVRLIADREQTEQTERGQVPGLARAGVPVWLDGEHQSAHNKIMVIDPGLPSALVITGSYNFTRAAQYKNAENVIFVGNSDSLVQAYVRNWQRHLRHSQPLTIH